MIHLGELTTVEFGKEQKGSIAVSSSHITLSLQELLKDKNIGILITDHNVQETLAITERSYLMFEGGILKSGIPEDLAADEMVRKVYLGQNFELRKKKLF